MRGTIVVLATLLGLGIAASLPAANAQSPRTPPVRVRGTIDAFSGQTLTVKTRGGALVAVALTPNFAVHSVVRKHLSDIHDGDFVASTSVRGKNGNLHAIEVHIFMPAQRGVVPEGQFPWDLAPHSLMTNAVVSGLGTVKAGRIVTVTYAGKSVDVEVDRNTPIVAYAPGDPGMLKRGHAVFIIAAKKPDGTLTTANVTVESKGVKPPM
ncbi:MAG: hypothetical protein KGL11_13920 [Alphaproteobacteria bacterium]|nr:hypothetical protein [Alphaproteobacteria bacterium]